MEHIDFFFNVKDLIKDACGKQAISCLMNFPLIFNYLNDVKNIRLIEERLGNEFNLWNSTNICKIASGIPFEKDNLNNTIDLEKDQVKTLFSSEKIPLNKKISNLEEIYPRAEQIVLQNQKIYWNNILDEFVDDPDLNDDPMKAVETLWSIVYELTEEKVDFIENMLNYSGNYFGPKFLARLILMNEAINEKLKESSRTIFSKISINNFVTFIQEMQFLGNQAYCTDLSKQFLEVCPIDKNKLNGNGESEIINDLNNLQYFKNYIILFHIVGNKEEIEIITNSANKTLATLENKFELITKSDFGNFSNSLFKKRGSNISQDNQRHSPPETKLVQKIKQIKDISKKDIESAKLVAKEIHNDLNADNDLATSIFDNDQGFLIKQEDLAQIFIDLGLITEAKEVLSLLLKKWPQNVALIRKMAELSSNQGDHKTAVNNFSWLNIINELSREEKAKFALSLEYLERWDDALEVRERINITSCDDIIDTAICAYKAGNLGVLEKEILNSEKGNISNTVIKVFDEIINHQQNQISIKEEKISSIDISKDKNNKVILLAAEFLQNSGENVKAIDMLNNYAKEHEYSYSIINSLLDLYNRIGDLNKSHEILNQSVEEDFVDQKSFEIYIDNLIHFDLIEKADKLLAENSNQWEISPRKLDLIAQILIEKRKFRSAKEILLPLINGDSYESNSFFHYCLAVLECRFNDFPLGIQIIKSKNIEFIKQLISKTEKENIFIDILEAELDDERTLEKYQKLIQKYSEKNTPEAWRLFAGLGKTYFNEKQFDLTIINVKLAIEKMPKNESLLLLLLQSYANLKLWNEIENLFNSNFLLNISLNNKTYAWLRTFSNFIDSPRFLEDQVKKHPDNVIYKILLSNSLISQGRKEEATKIIIKFFDSLALDDESYLNCVQMLVDIGESLLAERFIEIFMSNKKSFAENDYLSIAFLYEQLGRSEKSLSILNHLEINDPALIMYKVKLLNDRGIPDLAQDSISQAIKYDNTEECKKYDMAVNVPGIVKQIWENRSQIYLCAFPMELKRKNIEGALLLLKSGLNKHPEDQNILFNLIELLNRTGKNEELDRIISEHLHSQLEINLPSLSCVLGEVALSNGEEIKCAQYLSSVMKIDPDNPRVKALQSRLLTINGNIQESQKIFEGICNRLKINKNSNEDELNSINEIEKNRGLWLAKAALELGENRVALMLARNEIENIGYFTPNITLFLSALASLAETGFIQNELKIIKHLEQITEKELASLNDIADFIMNNLKENKHISDLLNKCKLFLNKDEKMDFKSENSELGTDFINSRIYKIYKEKGTEATEIAFNSIQTHPNHEIFLSILEKKDNPQKAFEHLRNVLKMKTADAITNTLLAIIEKNLGNPADAYAAISLALDEWPDEFNWQIMAGDLCKEMGDTFRSFSHYEKAQQLKINTGLGKIQDLLKLNIENETAIPILERELLKNPNKIQLIQLGKIYLKMGTFRKAVKAFESAANTEPSDPYPYYWLAKTASQLNNYEKALFNIEKALKIDDLNIDFISEKINILNRINKNEQAERYLNEKLAMKDGPIADLYLIKSKLITKSEGCGAALLFLNSINNLQENPKLLLEKARLEFLNGNLSVSESIAEALLSQNENKPQVLDLLGSIAKSRGELDRSIDFYIKAIEMDPFSPEQFIQLAEIYYERKDSKNTLEILENGIKANPGNFGLLYKAGLYYYQHGLFSQAEKRIKEAIRIEPNHKDAKEILRLLSNVIKVKPESLIVEPI